MDSKIIEKLNQLLQSGQPDELNQFLTDNLDNLPEDLKRLIFFSMVSEGSGQKLQELLEDYLMKTGALVGFAEAVKELEQESKS